MDFNAVHLYTLVNRSKILVLECGCIGTDQNDFPRPVIGRDFVFYKACYGHAVIIAALLCCERDVKMPVAAHRRQFKFFSAAFLVETCRLAAQRVDAAVFFRIYIEKSMAHHAVKVADRVNVAGGRALSELSKWRFVVYNSGSVDRRCVPAFPRDIFTEFRDGGGDDIAKFIGCICKTHVRLLRRVARIEHVDGGDSGFIVGIGGECFQRSGDDVPVPGVVGTEFCK